MNDKEAGILAMLKEEPEKAMSLIYDTYFQYLVRVVYRLLQNEDETQDIIQAVFIDIWKKRDQLSITSSLNQYLRRAAINKSLNYIRANKNLNEDPDDLRNISSEDQYDHSQRMEADEMQDLIAEAIEALPERCRLVFTLSRFESLGNKEIAEKMQISVKTVENQITKALKLMRYKIYEKNK